MNVWTQDEHDELDMEERKNDYGYNIVIMSLGFLTLVSWDRILNIYEPQLLHM